MADETLNLLRAGDPAGMEEIKSRHGEALRAAYTRGSSSWNSSAFSFDRFSEFCVKWVADRISDSAKLDDRLERLLSHPDLPICCGTLEGIEEASEKFRNELGPLLEELHSSCEKEYPNIGLSKTEFATAVLTAACRRSLVRGFRLDEAIRKGMAFPDFYLAAAALSEDSKVAKRAGDLFSKTYFPLAQSYVRKRWSTVPEALDRVSALFFCSLYEHTLSEKTGNPSKDKTLRLPLLSEYRGQGPLAAWLTLALGNMIRDSIRTTKTTISIDEEREVDLQGSRLPTLVLTSDADQRDGIDRSKCVRMLRAGLESAWKSLKPREQLTLVMQTLMEIPPSQIARKVFHVHEGTITKYTTSALKKIKDGLEAYAREKSGMKAEEAENCFEFMREAFPETETLAGGIVRAASED
jgi:DNA-directed RNA polymerase specialized sigma24 family protein